MRPLTSGTLLQAWELGRTRQPIDQGLMLFALASPEVEPDTLADEPLGRRNEALLRLRQATFGDQLRTYLDCSCCGQRLEFNLEITTLLATPAVGNVPIEVDGLRFRPPTSRDLAQIVQETGVEAAAFHLLRLCLIQSRETLEDAALEPLIDRVEAAMEQVDPWADFALDFQCEACGHAWTASLDIPGLFWEEIEARAVGLLDEVHLLAQAYGWREADILGLSEARRAAYLQRVTA